MGEGAADSGARTAIQQMWYQMSLFRIRGDNWMG
jgi:hypothetical protein